MWRSANQPLKSKVIGCVYAQDYSRNLSLLVSKLLAPVYLGRVARCIIIGVEGKGCRTGQKNTGQTAGRRGEGRGGGLGRSKIHCLAGVQEVGNRLLLNQCVDQVFSNQTGWGVLYKYFIIWPCMAGQLISLLALALALHTYDNTLCDMPPDILGLTILINTYSVASHCSEGNLAVFLLQERGCVNNPGHKHNKSPFSWEVDRQIFTSPRYGEVDRQICLPYFRRADLPSLWISLYLYSDRS